MIKKDKAIEFIVLTVRHRKKKSQLAGKIKRNSQFLWSTFWKEKKKFLSEQRRKTRNCFSKFCFLFCLFVFCLFFFFFWIKYKNTEEELYEIQIRLILYHCIIILDFLFDCLNILQIKNEIKHWMIYISMEGDYEVLSWIDRNRKNFLFLSDILYITLSFFLFINK